MIQRASSKATIMIVDDLPDNLRLLQELLQEAGYRLLMFTSGAKALQAAERQPPDLILLDITMPEMDGFEVCRRLKQSITLQKIPVLFISALGDTVDKVKAFSVGGVDYINKPFHADEVIARVNTHISLYRMQMELEKYNLHLEEMVREKTRELSDSHLAMIYALSQLAEHRDDDTGKHIERTRLYCKIFAKKLRSNPKYTAIITDQFIENIYHAAPLHDIGKVGIPDCILLKPGKLTPDEFETMKTHASIGASTLQEVLVEYPQNDFLKMGIELALYHHEKWDGSGYPKGLTGDEIPLSAQIMALADVYDALRSSRPYKEAFSYEKSGDIIMESAGKHFSFDLVSVFAGFCEGSDSR